MALIRPRFRRPWQRHPDLGGNHEQIPCTARNMAMGAVKISRLTKRRAGKIGQRSLSLPTWSGSGRRLVLSDELGRHAPAVLDVVTVFPRPGANSPRVRRAGPAAAPGTRPTRGPADLAGVLDVLAQRGAQLIAVLAAEVDFVVAAVEGEPDRAFGRAAVD